MEGQDTTLRKHYKNFTKLITIYDGGQLVGMAEKISKFLEEIDFDLIEVLFMLNLTEEELKRLTKKEISKVASMYRDHPFRGNISKKVYYDMILSSGVWADKEEINLKYRRDQGIDKILN